MEKTKASDDCWNMCRPHAKIMITIVPKQKRETLDINTEPREIMQDLVKNISNAANTQESFRAQRRFCSAFSFP